MKVVLDMSHAGKSLPTRGSTLDVMVASRIGLSRRKRLGSSSSWTPGFWVSSWDDQSPGFRVTPAADAYRPKDPQPPQLASIQRRLIRGRESERANSSSPNQTIPRGLQQMDTGSQPPHAEAQPSRRLNFIKKKRSGAGRS